MPPTLINLFRVKGEPYKAITVATNKEVKDITKIFNPFLYQIVQIRDYDTALDAHFDILRTYGRKVMLMDVEPARPLPALPEPIPGIGARSIHGKGTKGVKVKKDRSYSKYHIGDLFEEAVVRAPAVGRRPRATPDEARFRRAHKYNKNVPDVIADNLPNKFTTGTKFEVGTSRDSVLRAVNNTVAKISGIPLNRKNRNVINKIYGDELNAAYHMVGPDFTRRLEAGEFTRVRNVDRALRDGRSRPDGPTWKKQRNLSHINIPGVANKWVD